MHSHGLSLKREKLQQIKREGNIQGEGGLCKKTKNSYSPSKAANEWRNIPFLSGQVSLLLCVTFDLTCLLHNLKHLSDHAKTTIAEELLSDRAKPV